MIDCYPILELDVSVEELNALGFWPNVEDDEFGERLVARAEQYGVRFLFVGYPLETKEPGFVVWVDRDSCSRQRITGAEFLFYIFMELDLSETRISWRNQDLLPERWWPFDT